MTIPNVPPGGVPIPSPISSNDMDAMARVYRKLLSNRQSMIDLMKPLEQSAYRRGVLVDALISGLMDHFSEFARNPTVHQNEINNWGGSPHTFVSYIDDFSDSLYSAMKNIEPFPPPAGGHPHPAPHPPDSPKS